MNKFFRFAAAGALALSLVACGSSDDANTNTETKTDAGTEESTTLTVGATSSPHAIILEEVKPLMKEAGYDLEIKEFSDYTLIDSATSDGSLDANYFQHSPYLESYDADSGYASGDDGYLVSVGAIHYEPLGAYSKKYDKIDKDTVEDGALVIVPNDATNEARALYLLQDLGLITLNDDATISTATVADIKDNPKNLQIEELAAELTPTKLDEADICIVNGNYALDNDIVGDLKASESADSDAAKTYANVIAVKESNKDNAAVKKLVELLKSDDVKTFITDRFGVSVVPAA